MTVQPPSARANTVWLLLALIVVLFIAWLAFQSMGDDNNADSLILTETALPEPSATPPSANKSQEAQPTSPPASSPLPTPSPASYPLPTELPLPSPYPAPAQPYPLPTLALPTAYPAPEGG
jgi:outer membrane biosynthesis protein TonB